jgi:hypothetical protein
MSGNDLLLRGLKCAAVAILFAVSGRLSASLCLPHFPDGPHGLFYLFPVPFALLCIVLFMRSVQAVCALPIPMIWLLAYWAANFIGTASGDDLLPGFVGGLVGALGLVLCVSIGHPPFSFKRFAIGALVGLISGLSFASWVEAYHATDVNRGPLAGPPTPIHAFAIWQASMGTYLYVLSLTKQNSGALYGWSTIRPEPLTR